MWNRFWRWTREAARNSSIAVPAELMRKQAAAIQSFDEERFEEARDQFLALMNQAERRLGPTHLFTCEVCDLLGSSLFRMELFSESAAVHARAVAIFTECVGPDDPRTLSAGKNQGVAALLWSPAKGIQVLEGVLERRQRVLGVDHKETLDTGRTLGVALFQNCDRRRGVDILEQTHEHSLLTLGSDHPSTLAVRSDLAAALASSGRRREAVDTLLRLLKDYERVLGADHPTTRRTQKRLEAMGGSPQ